MIELFARIIVFPRPQTTGSDERGAQRRRRRWGQKEEEEQIQKQAEAEAEAKKQEEEQIQKQAEAEAEAEEQEVFARRKVLKCDHCEIPGTCQSLTAISYSLYCEFCKDLSNQCHKS